MAFAYFSFIVEIPYNSFFLATWCIFSNRSHAEITSSWGLLSLMDFLCEPQISKTPASFGTKRNPRGLSRTSASSFADSVSLGGSFCTPKKRGDVRRVTFEVGSCFFLGGVPPSFFVEILYQQLQSARDWQTWAKMAPLRNKSEKSDYSFKSSNENKQLGRVHCVISHFPVELEDLQSRKSAEIL